MGYKINQVIETGNKKIQTGTEEYIKFLKVVGNNYKYSASAQLKIKRKRDSYIFRRKWRKKSKIYFWCFTD